MPSSRRMALAAALNSTLKRGHKKCETFPKIAKKNLLKSSPMKIR
jgi:hypothetical protein